jgi:hypothetical protein
MNNKFHKFVSCEFVKRDVEISADVKEQFNRMELAAIRVIKHRCPDARKPGCPVVGKPGHPDFSLCPYFPRSEFYKS